MTSKNKKRTCALDLSWGPVDHYSGIYKESLYESKRRHSFVGKYVAGTGFNPEEYDDVVVKNWVVVPGRQLVYGYGRCTVDQLEYVAGHVISFYFVSSSVFPGPHMLLMLDGRRLRAWQLSSWNKTERDDIYQQNVIVLAKKKRVIFVACGRKYESESVNILDLKVMQQEAHPDFSCIKNLQVVRNRICYLAQEEKAVARKKGAPKLSQWFLVMDGEKAAGPFGEMPRIERNKNTLIVVSEGPDGSETRTQVSLRQLAAR